MRTIAKLLSTRVHVVIPRNSEIPGVRLYDTQQHCHPAGIIEGQSTRPNAIVSA